MTIEELFSLKLISFRKNKGLSQRELADKTGLTQRMIFHYENNPKSVPFENLQNLANILGIKIADFFNENKSLNEINKTDVRWIKKIKEIKKLSPEDQKEINKHINYLISKSQLKKRDSK